MSNAHSARSSSWLISTKTGSSIVTARLASPCSIQCSAISANASSDRCFSGRLASCFRVRRASTCSNIDSTGIAGMAFSSSAQHCLNLRPEPHGQGSLRCGLGNGNGRNWFCGKGVAFQIWRATRLDSCCRSAGDACAGSKSVALLRKYPCNHSANGFVRHVRQIVHTATPVTGLAIADDWLHDVSASNQSAPALAAIQ